MSQIISYSHSPFWKWFLTVLSSVLLRRQSLIVSFVSPSFLCSSKTPTMLLERRQYCVRSFSKLTRSAVFQIHIPTTIDTYSSAQGSQVFDKDLKPKEP